MKFKDRKNERFGRLLIISEAAHDPRGPAWFCRCDCGIEKIIPARQFSNKFPPRSCGCLQREKARLQGLATAKDRSGEKTGRLFIVSKVKSDGRSSYLCRCDCGNEIIARGGDLHQGRTQSCGCLQSEKTSEANAARAKHGHARKGAGNQRLTTPEYKSWKAMLERIRNPNAPNYHLYGGRGITICERWQGESGFNNFLSDMGERPEGMTLDRINNDGNYEPSNCRWADAKRQSNNRRNTPALKAARERNLKGGRKHWPRKPK